MDSCKQPSVVTACDPAAPGGRGRGGGRGGGGRVRGGGAGQGAVPGADRHAAAGRLHDERVLQQLHVLRALSVVLR